MKNERLKYESTRRFLIPAEECRREYRVIMKGTAILLETLPDLLERDCALTPQATSYVQKVIDDFRDHLAAELAGDKFCEQTEDPDNENA
ncbi:DUF1441 family protein [Enterobacter cloacae subsp. cloacae]|nr:DUF1441 family protein [Enterobacter cloacae subsp. cloacae]